MMPPHDRATTGVLSRRHRWLFLSPHGLIGAYQFGGRLLGYGWRRQRPDEHLGQRECPLGARAPEPRHAPLHLGGVARATEGLLIEANLRREHQRLSEPLEVRIPMWQAVVKEQDGARGGAKLASELIILHMIHESSTNRGEKRGGGFIRRWDQRTCRCKGPWRLRQHGELTCALRSWARTWALKRCGPSSHQVTISASKRSELW